MYVQFKKINPLIYYTLLFFGFHVLNFYKTFTGRIPYFKVRVCNINKTRCLIQFSIKDTGPVKLIKLFSDIYFVLNIVIRFCSNMRKRYGSKFSKIIKCFNRRESNKSLAIYYIVYFHLSSIF